MLILLLTLGDLKLKLTEALAPNVIAANRESGSNLVTRLFATLTLTLKSALDIDSDEIENKHDFIIWSESLVS